MAGVEADLRDLRGFILLELYGVWVWVRAGVGVRVRREMFGSKGKRN
jgi:hypothetical protein